ncbi:MAG: hypothetical protein ISN28_10310 [Ectothiorhodospiraceae bacterium AqS1]|nr:hypothetical protein [Ectothiorhodospiraceae bacterium AqS1]
MARERTWLYHTKKDWTLRYLFPMVSGGKALGAVGFRGSSYPGLTAVDVSDQFDFLVHEEYKKRFADLVERGEIFPALGQQTKVFLPARERFEHRREDRSNAPRATDERAAQQVRPAAKKEPVAGLDARGQKTTKRAEQGAPLPLTREWLEAQNWGSRKPIEKPADANTEQAVKTSAADTGHEAAKRARDRLSERQAAQGRRPVKERKQVAVPRTGAKKQDRAEAKQGREEARKVPKKKSSWGWRLALSAAALALGIPYIG